MSIPRPAASAESTEQTHAGLSRGLVWLMAAACGISVANLYYLQPVLGDVARTFEVSEGSVGFVATLGQLGYALGLLLLVPQGDTRNRRTLIVATLLAEAVALVAVALAPGVRWLAGAAFAAGVLTIAPQIIVPFAASLARPKERGKAVGTVMSGLLIGILLARTVSGFVGAHLGWRAMFWIAAALMIGLALVLRAALPNDPQCPGMPYTHLLRSLGTLVRTQPVLREASVFGALMFGSFSAFWVTLAFLLERPPYNYGSDVAGLFGLVGVVGALAASFAGRLTDRMNARRIVGFAGLITLVSWLFFWLFGGWIWGLVFGVILLDLGTQAAHISNQTRVYALIPEARSRLNTVYIVSYFLGGATGSALGTAAWSAFGWPGVCAVGGAMVAVGLGVMLVRR